MMIEEMAPSYLGSADATQACNLLHRVCQDVLAGVADRKLTLAFNKRGVTSLEQLEVVERNVLIELQFERPKDVLRSIVVLADAGELSELFALSPGGDGDTLAADALLRLGDIISSFVDMLVGELPWLQPAPRAWLANLDPIIPDPNGQLRCDMPRSLADEVTLYAVDFTVSTDSGETCGLQVIIGESAEQALLGLDQATGKPVSSPAPTRQEASPAFSAPEPAAPRSAAPQQAAVPIQPVQFKQLGAEQPLGRSSSIELIRDVLLKVSVELGHASLTVKEVLALGAGSVVELDRLAGEPVDVLVNDRLIARGEVVIVDESFGVRISEIVRGK
jgi:flagellar motor switch protein FliN